MAAVVASGQLKPMAAFPAGSTSGLSGQENKCHCFSMCHVDEARLFLSRLPPAISSTSSPWYEYLKAVYHGSVPLPFDLSRLRVFYRDTEGWRKRRTKPRVGLPLQRCVGRPRPREWGRSITDRTKFLYADHTHRRCADHVCRSWLVYPSTAEPVPWRPIAVTFREEYVEVRLLGGNHTQPKPHTRGASQPPSRWFPEPRMYSDGAWVEVMRSDFSAAGTREGQAGYGCWFYPIEGSGVFIQIGRSFHAHEGHRIADRTCAADASCRSPLLRDFLALPGKTLDSIPTPEGEYKELWPFAAHALGYDSLQVHRRHNLSGPGEIIITNEACSHSESPIRACPPIELRTGSSRERRCVCSESRSFLNCEGEASTVAKLPSAGGVQPPPSSAPPRYALKAAAFAPLTLPQRARSPPSQPPAVSSVRHSLPNMSTRAAAGAVQPSVNESSPSWVLGRLPIAPLAHEGEHPGWHRYLLKVYGDRDIRYPVDLRSFAWFYTISDLPLLQGRGVQPLRLGPSDTPHYGHAWVGRCERAHLGVCDPESFGGGGDLAATRADQGGGGAASGGQAALPPGFFVQLQQHAGRRRADGHASDAEKGNAPRNDWAAHYVEVVRVAAAHVDELRGVWYWEARGSGVWLHLGTSFNADSPASLLRVGVDPLLMNRTGPALRLMGALRALNRFDTVRFVHGSQAWMRNVRSEVVDFRSVGLTPTRHIRAPSKLRDFLLSPIKSEHEGQLMRSDTPFVARTCISSLPDTAPKDGKRPQQRAPSSPLATSPYRAGWAASRPCSCTQTLPLLNCGGRFPPFSKSESTMTVAETDSFERFRHVSAWHIRSQNSGSWRKTVVRQLGLKTWEEAVGELTNLV